jgi:hypothetical protein
LASFFYNFDITFNPVVLHVSYKMTCLDEMHLSWLSHEFMFMNVIDYGTYESITSRDKRQNKLHDQEMTTIQGSAIL